MSDIAITVQEITSVEPHPNGDRLEIVTILGATCAVPKGEYKVGDRVTYFPPGILLPPHMSEHLGVQNYLKHSDWDGERIPCRVAACRIRGVPSYGFPAPCPINCPDTFQIGLDVTEVYGARQYVAPDLNFGDPRDKSSPRHNSLALPEDPYFHKYTLIQQHWRYPDVFEDDEKVVITEKIHGTNSRVGVIKEDGEWVYAAGSHKVRWAKCKQAIRYWKPLEHIGVLKLLGDLCMERHNVIVFGEIYGNKVQDLNYGTNGDEGYAVFDISIDGFYCHWKNLITLCRTYEIPTVPLLFHGPYYMVRDRLEEFASCLTSVKTPKVGFKGREGIVMRPLEERYTGKIGGNRSPSRAIIKFISADYLDRKGAQDNG